MKGVRSLLGVPLLVEGAPLGVLHVGTVTPREFNNADAALLQLAAAQAAPAIDRARLFDALDREHRGAIALQRSLLPDRLPDLHRHRRTRRATCRRATRSAATGTTSIQLPPARSASPSGDVAGHGLRAAALDGPAAHGPARLRAGGPRARRDAQAPRPPAAHDLRARDGHRCYAVIEPGRACCATPAPATRRRCSCGAAGRPACWASMPRRRWAPLAFAYYHEVETTLEPGDTILLYTDGLSSAAASR